VPEPTTNRTATRTVSASVDELIAGATERTVLEAEDGKSGALLERVVIGGESFVLKHIDVRDDWTLRASGAFGGTTLELWLRGVLDRLPDCINQPILAVAHSDPDGIGSRGVAVLMRDVGEWLVPSGDDPIALSQHLGFLDHMAAMHAAFWQAGDEIDLMPMGNRYLVLSPWLASTEAAIGSGAFIPELVGRGWERFAEVAPRASAVVTPLAWDPAALVVAYGSTPTTLLHGNWKFGNLGSDADGRTVVIDWEDPGRGPCTVELAWYLAINSARLPQAKEDAITAYRDALERHGITTEPWWDRQLALALLGGLVHFGWEKAFGGHDDEMVWWEERALEARALL